METLLSVVPPTLVVASVTVVPLMALDPVMAPADVRVTVLLAPAAMVPLTAIELLLLPVVVTEILLLLVASCVMPLMLNGSASVSVMAPVLAVLVPLNVVNVFVPDKVVAPALEVVTVVALMPLLPFSFNAPLIVKVTVPPLVLIPEVLSTVLIVRAALLVNLNAFVLPVTWPAKLVTVLFNVNEIAAALDKSSEVAPMVPLPDCAITPAPPLMSDSVPMLLL